MRTRPCSNRPTQRGFTLLEVLIALVVVSIALGAIVTTVGNYASHAGAIKQKTLAHWVAMNQLTALQVSRAYPATGKDTKGNVEMAFQKWYWVYSVAETPDPNIRRIEILVKADPKDEGVLTGLVGYVSNRDPSGGAPSAAPSGNLPGSPP
jgi:general secretion pathway protein I